jgi:hypothetical protein
VIPQRFDASSLAILVLVETGSSYLCHRGRYKAANELWDAAERILAAFAALLGVLVQTLPNVFEAGRIALGGVWVINNVAPSSMHLPSFFRTSHRTARTTFTDFVRSPHRIECVHLK